MKAVRTYFFVPFDNGVSFCLQLISQEMDITSPIDEEHRRSLFQANTMQKAATVNKELCESVKEKINITELAEQREM